MRPAAALILTFLLAACQPEPSETPSLAPVGPALVAQERAACIARGGNFSPSGPGGTLACILPTSDAGQPCTASEDCEGLCLARSASCAPLTPLFGCHEVLLAGGLRVTQCID